MRAASIARLKKSVRYIIALSPIDSVALTPMRHPKDPQNGQVLDPSWTLIKDAGIGCPVLSSLSIPAISLAFQEIITSRPYSDSDRPIAPLLPVCRRSG